ncbi:MAG: hypothetical protein RMJ53_04480 [Chitinophagales bacterium]|nr:hypothetical protein [Chitinophagales bacterium]
MARFTLIITLFIQLMNQAQSIKENNKLYNYIRETTQTFKLIDKNRKKQLNEIANYITEKRRKNEVVKLVFICTHNSRRSHFGEAWARAAALYYNIPNVETYSGGTEATAANYRTMQALVRAGFIHTVEEKKENPKNILRVSEHDSGKVHFSKKYNDDYNPKNGFAAIMVCNTADEACPVVFGAEKRFAIPYNDPKISDNTPQETATYDERCRQIAREMLYVFSKVK